MTYSVGLRPEIRLILGVPMRWLCTTVFLLAFVTPAFAEDVLPSRSLDLPIALVIDAPKSFDLLDFREDARLPPPVPESTPNSFFVVKQHVGFAGGYDNGNAHASVGFYITVAEWGRWNFGVPSFEVGVGRYPVYDRLTNRSFMKDQIAFFVSLASAHYRAGYIRAWGLNWYLNLEQVFDMKANRGGSQFGISFSTK
jgi:hypothetical protein